METFVDGVNTGKLDNGDIGIHGMSCHAAADCTTVILLSRLLMLIYFSTFSLIIFL